MTAITVQTPWYNNLREIKLHTTTLADFTKLIEARRAALSTKEKLSNFIVRGTVYLDEFGQASLMSETYYWDENREKVTVDLSELSRTNSVLTRDGFVAWLIAKGYPSDTNWGHFMGGGRQIPHAGVPCTCCGQEWTMENLGDAWTKSDHLNLPLDDYVGKTLDYVRSEYDKRTDGVYLLSPDLMLTNPKRVSTTNEHGHVRSSSYSGADVEDAHTYVVQEGDVGFFWHWQYFHRNCMIEQIAERTLDDFKNSLLDAGFKIFGAVRLPNEYGSIDYRGPWFLFDTDKGYIRLGWRKRVIICQPHGNFMSGMTPTGDDVHLDNYEKLTEHLKQIATI
jgi:hypothetical protein